MFNLFRQKGCVWELHTPKKIKKQGKRVGKKRVQFSYISLRLFQNFAISINFFVLTCFKIRNNYISVVWKTIDKTTEILNLVALVKPLRDFFGNCSKSLVCTY